VEPVDVALALVDAADVRATVPAGGVCATADFGADVFDADNVASAEEAAADEAVASGDFREPEVDVEDAADVGVEGAFVVEADADADAALGVAVAGAAERVGGTGESPDPRSETSSMGEAQVPEYAASEGAAAHEPELEVVAEEPGALADFELEALVAAAGESGDAAPEIFVAVVAELANTGPEAFAVTAA
jgi:hypothetical protein